METRIFTIVLLAFGWLSGSGVASALPTAKLKVQILSELDKFEPFDAHLFHAGHLWAGRSRKDLAAFYRLEVYDSAGKAFVTKELKHSARHITAYGANGVLVVGVAAEPNQTFYTTAILGGGDVTLKTVAIPISAWADRGVGVGAHFYFTDPGGLDDGSPIGVPLKTLFTLQGSTPKYLNARIRGPQNLIPLGSELFIVENESMGHGGTNLIKFDLKSESLARLFPAHRSNLNNMIQLPTSGMLALSENRANQVLLVDPRTWKHTATLAVPAGDPRGLAEYGHCLVVGSDNSRQVSFIDLKQDSHPVVAQWDLSAAGDKFLRLRNLSIEPKSGRLYARSSVPCMVMAACPDERNSVLLVQEEGDTTAKACL